jgi:hypothetical protein
MLFYSSVFSGHHGNNLKTEKQHTARDERGCIRDETQGPAHHDQRDLALPNCTRLTGHQWLVAAVLSCWPGTGYLLLYYYWRLAGDSCTQCRWRRGAAQLWPVGGGQAAVWPAGFVGWAAWPCGVVVLWATSRLLITWAFDF